MTPPVPGSVPQFNWATLIEEARTEHPSITLETSPEGRTAQSALNSALSTVFSTVAGKDAPTNLGKGFYATASVYDPNGAMHTDLITITQDGVKVVAGSRWKSNDFTVTFS